MKAFLFVILMLILTACATTDKRECRKKYLDNHLNDLDNVLTDSEDLCQF